MNPLVHKSQQDGATILGMWLNVPNPFVAEVAGEVGYDFVVFDLQHGVLDDAGWLPMLQALRTSPAIPLARVAGFDVGLIGRLLDAGVRGILLPLVESAETARQLVRACRYAPDGDRSFGPTRAEWLLGATDYVKRANADTLVIPMIETEKAIAEIDSILAVPGVDAMFVGPADLSITLGLPPGGDHDNATFRDSIARAVTAATDRGLLAGIASSPTLAARHSQLGYRMLTVGSDVGSISRGLRGDLAAAKGALDTRVAASNT